MFTVKGHYTEATVYADKCEPTALAQIYGFLNHPAFEGSHIAIMPDVHAGAGAVVGFTATQGVQNMVIPNVIGVDIGCGVVAQRVTLNLTFEELDRQIRALIPVGFGRNKTPVKVRPVLEKAIKAVCVDTEQDEHDVFCSIGSLGGGNHYIELDQDETGTMWLTIHSGSRNFGLKIANWHQRRAIKQSGKQNGLEYLTGDDAKLYLEHMHIAQDYANLNRGVMLSRIGSIPGVTLDNETVRSVHNYRSFDDHVTRKGAIQAKEGQLVIIPWNMRDGSIIGVGLGNEEWNQSAPHGAGRRMSRGQAKRELSMDEYRSTMSDVWSSCIKESTLDEAPMAYKDHTEVLRQIIPTVQVLHTLKPVYNLKG